MYNKHTHTKMEGEYDLGIDFDLMLRLYLALPDWEPVEPLTMSEDNHETRHYNYIMFDAFEPRQVAVTATTLPIERVSQRIHNKRQETTTHPFVDDFHINTF